MVSFSNFMHIHFIYLNGDLFRIYAVGLMRQSHNQDEKERGWDNN